MNARTGLSAACTHTRDHYPLTPSGVMVAILVSATAIAADEPSRRPASSTVPSRGEHERLVRPPLFEHAPPEDLYGDELPAGALLRLGTTRFRNRGRAECVAFSPDGRWLASGGEAVRVFDAAAGRLVSEVARLKPADGVYSLAFSADGSRIATGDRDGQLRVYSIIDGTEIFVGGHPGRGATAIAFLADGKTLVSFGGNGDVRLWNIEAGKEVRVLEHGFGRRSHDGELTVSRDGRLIAASVDNGIRIWNVETGAPQAYIAQAHDYRVTSLAFTPDGERLLSCGNRRVEFGRGAPELGQVLMFSQIRSWNVETGEMERELLKDEPGSLLGLAVAAEDDMLFAATERNALYFSPATGEVLRSLDLPDVGKPGYRKTLAMSPDGTAVAIATWESAVYVVDLETGMLRVLRLDSHTAMVRAIDWSADGNYVVTGSSDGTVRIWDALTSQPLQLFEFSDRCMNLFSVALSPDCEYVAAAGNYSALAPPRATGAVKVWHVPTGRLLFTVESEEAFFNLAFSGDGKMLAAARFTEDLFGSGPPRPRGAIDIYGTENGERLFVLAEQDGTATALAFTPDDDSLISIDRNGMIRTWSLPSGELERTTKVDSGNTATISANSTVMVTGRSMSVARAKRVPIYTLTIRDLPTAEALHTLDGFSGFGAHALDISSDGKLLASGCQSDAITVWSMATGEKLLELQSPQAKIFALAFEPSGHHVVTGMDDGTAVVWDVSRARKMLAADE